MTHSHLYANTPAKYIRLLCVSADALDNAGHRQQINSIAASATPTLMPIPTPWF